MTCACQAPILGLGWFGVICVACGHPAREERGATVGVLDWLPAAKENPGLRYEREELGPPNPEHARRRRERQHSRAEREEMARARAERVEQTRRMREERRAAILAEIAQREETSAGQIMAAVRISPSTLQDELRRLVRLGIVLTNGGRNKGRRYILPRSPQGTGPRAIAPMTPGAGTGSGGGAT